MKSEKIAHISPTAHRSLFDMHCHLGFAPNAQTICAESIDEHIAGAFCATLNPRDYADTARLLAPWPHIRVGIGLHPWEVGAAPHNIVEQHIEQFIEMVPLTRFIGEVGLDFAQDCASEDARAHQISVFDQVLTACDTTKSHPSDNQTSKVQLPKIISIHAVRSTSEVLDLLEKHHTAQHHCCIFHWFSGTSDELYRARNMGCYFSINPRMLATKRGRAYVRSLPLDRIVLETDTPPQAGDSLTTSLWADLLGECLSGIIDARLENNSRAEKESCVSEIAATIARTSAQLLGLSYTSGSTSLL